MLARPIYETARDRQAEVEVADKLAPIVGGEFVKLHHTYRLDFAIYESVDPPTGLQGFCEVKDRSGRFHWAHFDRHGFYRLSLHKWMSAADLCRIAEVPLYLAIRCRDGLYVAKLRPDRMLLPTVIHGGRTDRKVRDPATGEMVPDPGDQEPMVEIPTNLFREV
jgi:hypothetical protein